MDTGPIVALLHARDAFHGWAVDAFSAVKPPLYTCEPVLAEAAHLLRRSPGGPAAVLALVERGVLRVGLRVEAEASALKDLMKRYGSVPMSLADACLVRMVEIESDSAVLTLDADFKVYRRGRQVIPLVTPW